jgi:hypothetical protein
VPLVVKKQGANYILTEPSGKRAKHTGKHKSKKKAYKQIAAIKHNTGR